MASEQILIVEDEGIVAEDISHSLEGLGYRVSAVTSTGEDAIRKAAETHPDLVLMDIILDGEIDGVAAAKEIRSRLRIPVVYLTAHADEATLQRAKTAEVYGYITKPFDIAELRSAIEVALYKHRIEERLFETQQWLATTLHCVGDGVMATDAHGRVTFLNAAAETIIGWRQQEVLGRPLKEIFHLLDRSSRQPIPDPVDVVLREEQVMMLPNPCILVAKDGTERWVDDSAAPIRSEQGAVIGVVLAVRDITEKVRVEETLRKNEEALRQSQKMEAIGRMAGGIAHDFNNMLTSVLGFSTLIHDQIPETDPMRKDVEEILRTVDRAADLTKQLLSLSRRKAVPGQSVHLNLAIQRIAHLLKRTLPEDIQIVTELDPLVGGVQLDSTHVQQVIMNLAINARDAMPAGGKIVIRTTRVALDECFCSLHPDVKPGDYIAILVKDTGVGMSEAVHQHAFEPFFTTKEQGKGTGLGLSIVYGIVKQCGGAVELESHLGRGTTVMMYLPHVDLLPEMEAPRHAEKMPRGTETILAVDDEETVLNLAVRVLEPLGYKVLRAGNGSEALQASDRHEGPIDLMITDVIMPEMGGGQLAEIMIRKRPDMKIVFVSGYTEQSLGPRFTSDPAIPLIEKPFTPQTLAQVVRSTLDRKPA